MPITLGQGKHTLTMFVNFVVLDEQMAYNTIFGRLLMRATQMVTVVYCLMIKFPTPMSARFVRVNLKKSRECQVRAVHLT